MTTLVNCVVWGNPLGVSGDPLVDFNSTTVVTYSNIEGGYSGTGIIDADPLFAQPGTGNLGLTEGSPCLDAGNAAWLPADIADIDYVFRQIGDWE